MVALSRVSAGIVCLSLIHGALQPSFAQTAGSLTLPNDKALAARSITAYLRDERIAVRVAAVAVQGPWALADWKSADGRTRGRALLRYSCFQWNVEHEGFGNVMNTSYLISQGVPSGRAKQLIADIAYEEASRPPYVVFQPVGPAC